MKLVSYILGRVFDPSGFQATAVLRIHFYGNGSRQFLASLKGDYNTSRLLRFDVRCGRKCSLPIITCLPRNIIWNSIKNKQWE